ncbi:MAG: hypothetical protein U0872_01245 [Planctomycetaceae bacterium]
MLRTFPCLAVLVVHALACSAPADEFPGRNPRVIFIVDDNCPRCEEELVRLKKDAGVFSSLRASGWKIGDQANDHIQIISRKALADLNAGWELREYPAVACIENGEIVRSFQDGCTTPLDVWTFGFLLKGKDERPKESVPEAVRVKSTGSYPLRGNHWSVDGDFHPSTQKLIGHLRGPNHAQQIAGRYAIEAWSYEELRSLHDDLHEREMASGTAPAFANSSPARSGGFQFRADHKALGR